MKIYGMPVLALSLFVQTCSLSMHMSIDQMLHCYQARALEYEDGLERVFTELSTK